MHIRSSLRHSVAALSLAVAMGASLRAGAATPRLVTEAINDAVTVSLPGNTRPEALVVANDRGPVADTFELQHMQLLLNRPAFVEAALIKLIAAQEDSKSPLYRHWLSAEQFGAQFGPAEADVQAVTDWLTGHGFVVDGVQTSRMVIEFSGNAGTLRDAFHTEIHTLSVNGAQHIANMSDPRIPAALAGIIHGVVSLNDFKPAMYYEQKAQYTFSSSNGTFEAVVPADLATIYNFNPLFNAAYSGQGETVTVVEDSDVYSTGDWTKFRSEFGLSSYKGAFKVVHPTGSSSCTAPGVQGAEFEAILDAEWASAAAPSATIQLASCKDTTTTFGGLIALQNLINSKTPPAIISLSYGVCEAFSGATQNAAFEKIYQQAVALGSSVFVSSGDQNAAVCDRGNAGAQHGIAVNGWGSSVYNVSVGGTDFGDTYAKTNATYWNSTNTKYYGSAKSYVPEIPWNNSCANALISTYLGYKTTYGASGFCNSADGSYFYEVVGGSGGPSKCATGVPKTAGVVSGTCKGFAKPSWQVVLGNPKDGVRDLPDVSLFAANGIWGHYYVVCDSDPSDGGTCTGAPSGWLGAGGTSFASPIMASVQALINQYTKTSKAGNPAPTLYKLAAAEFGTAGATKCDASLGNKVSSTCVFYDTRLGDNDVDCIDYNCYLDSASVGVLSTSTTKYASAYATGNGWDFATGLGSVNVTNLVKAW